ncbi:hypothetical protein CVS40_0064 [Lucilia cuprina]|nr:hypothetical protein CVS40_0064 [Lucilia cuprina]
MCLIKPQTVTPNAVVAPTSAAASSAAYYQSYNNMQAQARPTLSNNPGNSSTAYGIFLGNKVTYVAASPTNPSLIYNQHSTTSTNFISNSLANAALATSPTILYTNPMLTTTTQQYLNTFFKETQYLSTALTANSTQTATAASNASGVGLYERLLYAQMLQQQLYQTQQAAAVAAMFQHKQRAAAAAATLAAAARQSGSGNVATSSNRSSPQHLASVSATTTSNNGSSLVLTILVHAKLEVF